MILFAWKLAVISMLATACWAVIIGAFLVFGFSIGVGVLTTGAVFGVEALTS